MSNIPDYMKVTPSKPDHCPLSDEQDHIRIINLAFGSLMRQGWRDDEPPTDGAVVKALYVPTESHLWRTVRVKRGRFWWECVNDDSTVYGKAPYLWRPLTEEEAKT